MNKEEMKKLYDNLRHYARRVQDVNYQYQGRYISNIIYLYECVSYLVIIINGVLVNVIML